MRKFTYLTNSSLYVPSTSLASILSIPFYFLLRLFILSFHFFPSSLSFFSSFFLSLFLSPLTPPLSPSVLSSYSIFFPAPSSSPSTYCFPLPLLHLLSSILVAFLSKLPSTFFPYCTSTSSDSLLIHLLFYLLPAFLFSTSLSQISLYLSYYAFFFLFLLLFNPCSRTLLFSSFFLSFLILFPFKLYLPILVCKKNFFLD